MRCIGHRGCPAHAPENTLLAVETAAPHVDMVEVDVRRCGSGELVVFHDERLDRLTDGTGRLDRTDWRTLRELRVDGSEEGIPLLADVVDAVPAEVGLNAELKHDGLAREAVSLLEGFAGEVVVSSFEASALEQVRARSDLPLAYLFHRRFDTRRRTWRRGVRRARELGCTYLHPEYRLCLDDDRRVVRATKAGLRVNAWTVPDRRSVRRLRRAGVDGVIVDDWRLV
ncbi:glycerophosphodiester phosphodiesterase [Halomarina ordinaria]|uniref:Glycerophosphodiester phosphodiesterase n=1 Tax=Halomarina ordinaria TaxID=3033939 RepID=A0ABD5U4K2_9EURY|nr:glycerophosphodiester phosphodiesterase [Halomarina sp. PSRA2]